MSTILKGIDLPKDRDCVNLSIYQNGDVYEQMDNGFYIIINAEAIQIPKPHGRLIDKDELLSHLKKDPLFSLVEQYGISGVIESRPTILESED